MPPSEPRPTAPLGEDPLPGKLSELLRLVACAPEVPEPVAWAEGLRPGAVVGRFELVRELGRGGFGVVYEAKDRELGRAVAFKAVRPGQRDGLREDVLLREAEATARLSHPNIVTIFDAGQGPHGPYLVLELLHGLPLARRLEQGSLPVDEALRIAVEVSKGLAHAHASGVIHRDLSPGNVFLCQDGQVKLLDLGLAHVFGRRRVEGGTPRYVAPEQWRGAPEDERTDVYSLGVILFRMLTGQHPSKDGAEAPERPAVRVELEEAPGLGPLLERMLDPDPVGRPRHAGEVLAVLQEVQRALERSASAPAPPQVRRRLPRRLVAALAAAGLALGLGLSWLALRGLAARPPRPPPSIAVLPFEDLSPQQDQAYFSDGLADEILTALGTVDGLRVPGRISSFAFKGKGSSLAEIGQALQVGAVLEGSVRRAGNRVRVTAQIVMVADGNRLWSQAFERELGDIFAIQEEIARAVVSALDVKLMGRPPPSLKDHTTTSPEAYTQYLIGRQELRRYGAGSLQRALAAFERALALDPGYAPAWAGLAYPVFNLADAASGPAAVHAERRRALAAAERAVELAPSLPEALAMRAVMRSYVSGDAAGARADLERAIAIAPGDATAHVRYAVQLLAAGRLEEAAREARLAAELDPLSNAWVTLGTVLQFSGALAQADEAYRRQLHVSAQSIPATVGLVRNLVLQGRAAEALELNGRLPESQDRLTGQAMAEHLLGRREASDAALAALVAEAGDADALTIAEVHALRGERDQAFAWLERALSQREATVFTSLRSDPFLRGLAGDPRFADLVLRAEAVAVSR